MSKAAKKLKKGRRAILAGASESLVPAELLFNRELGWLEFNRRVLEEALDETQPLLERLKFLSIFSTNLDEFFMIRVSGLKEEMEEEVIERSPDGMTPAEQLKEIGARLRPMIETQMRCLREEILPQLELSGIRITSYKDLDKREKQAADEYFTEHVFPILTPQAVDPGHPFPYVSNLSLNLGLMVEPEGGRTELEAAASPSLQKGKRFARIKLPEIVPHLVPVDETGRSFTLLGSLIAANADALFPEMHHGKMHLFRVTRDADIEIREDEAGDLLRTMQQQLRRRRFGSAVRLEVSATMPAKMVAYLTTSLSLTPDDVYVIDGQLNLPDLMQLYQLDLPELKDKPLQVSVPALLLQGGSVFDAVRRRDVLLHHPYTSYTTVIDFISTAANDPNVLAIKMCLYRTGKDSPVIQSLMEASEQGKQVTALVELKARFDEENNIEWARRLEQAGVHVIYGLVGLKTHCKLALVVRREGGALKRYVHLATGNYNPVTSRVYTDIGIFTADRKIGEDASNLFNYLTGYSRYSKYRCLLVAPVNLRERIIALIEREREHARAGRPARIIVKINSLTDLQIIRSLYDAAQAGVSIDLIIRGVCMLRPGVPGLSENIRVRSIVGRFLEHSRVYFFANDGDEEVYIGSADWMHRNLDRRVEVVVPVKDQQLRRYLKEVLLDTYLRDNVKARILQADGAYARAKPLEDEGLLNSQDDALWLNDNPLTLEPVDVVRRPTLVQASGMKESK
ncbi:MAG: polyphosphate kinase [Acidobacteriota bacterium]|jgi:polyphosphate kinase|nr:polyphosphate kinase [Acidobacteriota bacterium]